jgi:hypothetical protein
LDRRADLDHPLGVGGVAVNSLLWLVLVVALIVAIFAMMSGRRV